MDTGIVLDSITHDLVIENNGLTLFQTDEDATVQRVKIRLLVYKGEWFRDINYGVPYLQEIFGKDTKNAADANLKSTILGTENVKSLLSYQSTIGRNRTLQVVFSIKVGSGKIINDILVEI